LSKIVVRFTSVDGPQEERTCKTVDEAEGFIHRRLGESPKLGSDYTVKFSGVGKIEIMGDVALRYLFHYDDSRSPIKETRARFTPVDGVQEERTCQTRDQVKEFLYKRIGHSHFDATNYSVSFPDVGEIEVEGKLPFHSLFHPPPRYENDGGYISFREWYE
jgi:hypothetical protein